MRTYLIGQRVIVSDEIGTVQRQPENTTYIPNVIWVFRPSYGFASAFSPNNVKPLPNGQL